VVRAAPVAAAQAVDVVLAAIAAVATGAIQRLKNGLKANSSTSSSPSTASPRW
jgi:hypothetical protein